jgi:hypothetical protein
LRRKLFTLTLAFTILIIAGTVLFLMSYHIVSTGGGLVLIPKQHLSFTDTIVKLDKILARYNDANYMSRKQDAYLVERLIRKGLIAPKDPVTAKTEEQAPQRPSQLNTVRTMLDKYYREHPVGDGWNLRVTQKDSHVYIVATIPFKQATAIRNSSPYKKLKLAKALCPGESEEIWELINPGEYIHVQFENKGESGDEGAVFIVCDCN